MHYTYTPVTLECNHCAARVFHPRWARVEPGRYIPLCWICFDAIDLDFTAAAAILEALAIVRRSAVAL